MKGSNGPRRRTRNFHVEPKSRGKISISRYLQQFEEAETVSIVIDSRYQSVPHKRFQGKTGVIVGKQGRAYYISVRDGNSQKTVLVNPEHLKPQQQK
ncbi:50S ribosomal protein L21e [uncultured archaeon]|nr:50S ribosomal protein L21e [uncultured archaeon]